MTQTVRLKCDRRAQPRIPPPETARTTPEDGDIVIREEARHEALVYVLHATPSTNQDLIGSRREAIARARALAKRLCVRAWRIDEGYDFTLLEDFRVATASEDVRSRLRAEFLEMPGLRLKRKQVQRLCNVEETACQMALDALVNEKVLCMTPDGCYARLIDGADVPRPKPATAGLPAKNRFLTAS
jgi:hypothetical protein